MDVFIPCSVVQLKKPCDDGYGTKERKLMGIYCGVGDNYGCC